MKKLLFVILALPFSAKGQIITTIAGGGTSTADSIQATTAIIGYPAYGITDNHENYFFSETGNNKVRKIDPAGIITTVAGNGTSGFSGDNGLATLAHLKQPSGLAVDNAGNLYIVDIGNLRIRKVNHATGILTTIAGNGNAGYSGDNGLAVNATFSDPYDICLDTFNNIYITDASDAVVRKINATTGIITTYAGMYGATPNTGDNGPATSAGLSSPEGICSDKKGNIYITEPNIRKVDAITGIITTVAGKYSSGTFSGDNGPADSADLFSPVAVVVDKYDNIYIADTKNNRIRKVDHSTHIITTVAGNGMPGFSGDNGPADSAKLDWPEGIAVDTCGNLYIADLQNYRIRKVTFNPPCSPASVINISTTPPITIYPNPTNDLLHIDNIAMGTQYSISNILGALIQQGILIKTSNSIDIQALPPGMYVLVLSNNEQRVIKKIVKQ